MKIKYTALSGLALIVLLSSCATIFGGKKTAVTINTSPSGAEVYDSDRKLLGTTPYEIKNIEKRKKVLTIRKEGYDSTDVTINKRSRNEFLFMDAMLFCIPCIVDFSSDKINYLEELDSIYVLRKKAKKYESAIRIAIGKSERDFSESKYIGRINGSTRKIDDSSIQRMLGRIEDMDDEIVILMKESYFDPCYESDIESSRYSFKKPKILIKAFVTDLDLNYTGKYLVDLKGKGTINVKWKIFKELDRTKPISEINLKTTVQRNKGGKTAILHQLIQDATRDLMSIDTLYDYLKGLEGAYYVDVKGNEIEIQQPPVPKSYALKDVLKTASSAVVTVEKDDGSGGSGVIISKDGYLITNYHVVEEDKSVTVRLNQDIKLNAEVVKLNKDFDLALLKINAGDLKALRFGDSDSTSVGDDIYAIGTPLETTLGQSVTKGIISGYREIKDQKFIQTDVSINPGNSGGPLINEKGEIIGIATWKLSGRGVEGIGFGIPSNAVMEMLNIKWKK